MTGFVHEYNKQMNDLAADHDAILNKPPIGCHADEVIGMIDRIIIATNSQHNQQCIKYVAHLHNQVSLYPNPVMVVSTLLTRCTIEPVTQIIDIINSQSYFLQSLLITAVVLTVLGICYL